MLVLFPGLPGLKADAREGDLEQQGWDFDERERDRWIYIYIYIYGLAVIPTPPGTAKQDNGT